VLLPVYQSKIGAVIVFPGFTRTSADRDFVISRFITGEDNLLFEISVFPGDGAAAIHDYRSGSRSKSHIGMSFLSIPATQVFQVLDLTLFGVLKRCPRYELPFDENNATVKVRTKVYHEKRAV
jgi:hypothetical protein